jgi:hypothetical protein
MYLPTTVLKKGDFSKTEKMSGQQRVFKDKIVDAKRSPFLYNIETGNLEMDFVLDGTNPNFKMTMETTSADRGYVARQMLLKTNISYVTGEREFSLLSSMSNKEEIKNKNITDIEQLEQTFNSSTTAEDKYKYTNDPFFKADENEQSSQTYIQEVNEHDQIAIPPDLSRIASAMADINLSRTYKGKSKYFMKHSSGVE